MYFSRYDYCAATPLKGKSQQISPAEILEAFPTNSVDPDQTGLTLFVSILNFVK